MEAGAPRPRLDAVPHLSLNFFRAGILFALLAGILPGAWLLTLLARDKSFAALPAHWIQVHGEAQIFGFLVAFILGFGYQAFPRFRGLRLRLPRLAGASLPALVLGVALRCAGELRSGPWAGARAAAVCGAVLEFAAIAAFVTVIVATGRQDLARVERPGAASHAGYVISAALWLLLSAGLGIPWAGWIAGLPEGPELSRRLALGSGALRAVQLHGVLLLMITGVSTRLLPGFLGGAPDPSGRAVRLLPWLNLAVLLEAIAEAGVARDSSPVFLALRSAAALTLGAGTLALVLPLGLYSRRTADSVPRPFLRAAWGWGALSFLMAAVGPVYLAALGRGSSHGWMDAGRHAFTMGFALLTLVGIASMVVPALSMRPRLARAPLRAVWWCLNSAVLLRVGGEILTDYDPLGYTLAGASGLLALAGFAWWAGLVWSCMARAGRGGAGLTPGAPAA